MMHTLTLLLIGFSVVSAAILLFAYVLFLDEMQKSLVGVIACSILLLALAVLQLNHLAFLQLGTDLFSRQTYVIPLLTTPPAFYFFSRELLLPESRITAIQLVHFIPLALGFVIPANVIAPIAFVIGSAYAIWFTTVVYGMRRNVGRFKFEMFFFGLFAVLAVFVLLLGIMTAYIDASNFYVAYANFIGIAFILIVAALIVFPELLGDITDAAKLSYASSTLNDVDIEALVSKLEKLMLDDKIYQNENLNLASLADAMSLSSHQLSELINTRFGIGFSRYVRLQRVEEAKRILHNDAHSSILSISLMTGFKSQSNFYAAFREITGEAPGSYRRNP
jgi:AraC-like DNA-binding protein